MKTFIEEVALSLYEKYGDDISSLTLIVPSKRARLFFTEALLDIAASPIWEPKFASIDDMMVDLSALRKADKLRLIAELYNIYKKHHKEEFDEFYHWGEVLIADFDMIDKYMVDAQQLFRNVSDLKELESNVDYLSDLQLEMMSRFWNTIVGGKSGDAANSQAKTKFLEVWRSLGAIYEEFKGRLRELRIGYTGMIYREAVERFKEGKAQLAGNEKYICIGFNALSTCEQELLRALQVAGRAEFYWDYDKYYTEDRYQEAGMFIRSNVDSFGEAEGISHDNLRNIQSVNVFSTSSNVAQCQCVVDILERIAEQNGGVLDKDTAVVLTDENLLMPLLYALPEKFKERVDDEGRKVPQINVTMGYPLRNTLAYSFVERLLELQKHARKDATTGAESFYYVDVEGLLTHPYVATSSTSEYANLRSEIVKHRLFQVPQSKVAVSPLLSLIFRKVEDWRSCSNYLLEVVDALIRSGEEGAECAFRTEFLAAVSEALNKLQNIVAQCGIDLPEKIYHSLVRRHLQAERVPFTGEPLQGLQIMGILETRNLDFKNVIILSMTDNNFPGNKATDKSFIPYGLRYGFKIPTAEHHEGVYAYYFYRLIERAEQLYMLYSSAADDKSTGEPSRYIRQLEYETDFKIDHTNVGVEVSLSDNRTIEVKKSPEVFEKLLRFTRDKALSPTAFSTYVKCPLRFYFNVVELLRSEDELEESVDNMTFGNIFHEAADKLYSQIIGEPNPNLRLKELRESGEVERCVDRAIAKVYFGRKDEVLPELGGELVIIRNIVIEYLGKNLLNYDIDHPEFTVFDTERTVAMEQPIEVDGQKFNVKFEGRSDRIDTLDKEGLLRIIDYKTGKPHLEYRGIEGLFHGEANLRQSNIINTLLYSMMLSREHNGRDVRPELYYVGSMVHNDYSPLFIEKIDRSSRTLNSYMQCAEEFEGEVHNTLCEMFDSRVPFRQCEDEKGCEYCDYRTICRQ